MHGGAVLDCCFQDDFIGFSGSADHTVRRYDHFLTYYHFRLVLLVNCIVLSSINYGLVDRFLT